MVLIGANAKTSADNVIIQDQVQYMFSLPRLMVEVSTLSVNIGFDILA